MRHLFLGLLLSLLAGAVSGQVQFVEVGEDRGILPSVMEHGKGGSVLAVDYDEDGDIDLFVPNAGGVANQLYRNLGDGNFTNVAPFAGLASTQRSRIALFFDYDGDHLLDLFTAGDCFEVADPTCPDTSTLHLYRQLPGGSFVEVTEEAGIPDDQVIDNTPHRGAAAAGDLEGDGDLDLIFGIWSGTARLLRNDGGTFTEVSDSSGVTGFGYQWQPLWHDFNHDGLQDIYHVTDFASNLMWINQGDGSFNDVAFSAGTNNAWNDMGQTLGDYDSDGDFDIYVTNIKTSSRNNVLFRNDSTEAGLAFTRVSFEAGVDDGGWGWGTTFFDADNDGDVDLASTNGWFSGSSATDTSKFFLNVGGNPVTFSEISQAAGFDDSYWGSSLIALDYDRDGDLDLAQSCNGNGTQPHKIRLLENRTAGLGNHLVIQPRMPGANHWAIGTVVRAEVGDHSMMRLITAGTSAFGQEPAEAFFGLGSATMVDLITIEWPDGTVRYLSDVAAGQVLIVEPEIPFFRDGFESGDVSAWSVP